MINVYLFIELLRATSPGDIIATLKQVEMANCKFANIVELSDEKLVAQLDCNNQSDATKAILERIAPVKGIVQTNIIAVVRPVHQH